MDWDKGNDEALNERYYRRNTEDGNFWGGGRTAYRGQKIIHFEEFSGNEPFHKIKEVMDIGKPGCSVNIKGSGTELNHETVILTSNIHPAGWYRKMWRDDPKQFHPFWRRVTEVRFYPAMRKDREHNRPDVDNPPEYVDQTEEWKTFQGDYSQAVEHADLYRPLAVYDSMLIDPQVPRWER
jgi:hypothetical protein